MLERRIVSRKRLRMRTAADLLAEFIVRGELVEKKAMEHLNSACLDLQKGAQEQSSGYVKMRKEAQQCVTRIKRSKRPNGDIHESKSKQGKKKKHKQQQQQQH